MYSYTSNNPVNFVDPTGHAWIVDSNSRGEIQTIASAAKPTKKIQYRKPISKSSSKTTAKKSTSIKKVAKAATKAGRIVIDFSNGVGAGVAESVTLGTSNSLDSYWGRENEGVYISGKIVGNGIMAIAGGVGAGASGAGAIVTSPTGVGAVAFSGAAVASVGVSASAVACYSHNMNVMFSMSGDKGAGNGGHSTPQQLNQYKNQVTAGKDVNFNTKEQALEFIEKKFPDFQQEVAGGRSAEGWHFDSHPIGGSESAIDHINIYSKSQGFRVHITWGN